MIRPSCRCTPRPHPRPGLDSGLDATEWRETGENPRGIGPPWTEERGCKKNNLRQQARLAPAQPAQSSHRPFGTRVRPPSSPSTAPQNFSQVRVHATPFDSESDYDGTPT